MASTVEHRSHGHTLKLMGWSATNEQTHSCRACSHPLIPGRDFYGCCACSYFLHRTCAHLKPSYQQHRAHKNHAIHLFCAPPSGTGAFSCDICGKAGSLFNYRCQNCDFIAHSCCVILPSKAESPAHDHPLRLHYTPPSKRSTHCNVCRERIQYCCYSCPHKKCVFDLHLECKDQELPGDQSGRKKGYKRAKAKKIAKRFGAAVLHPHVLTELAHAGAALIMDEDIADHEDDAENDDCDGDDHGDDDSFFDFLDSWNGTVDGDLQEEYASLLQAHMKGMSLARFLR